jgi:hypothetical protein
MSSSVIVWQQMAAIVIEKNAKTGHRRCGLGPAGSFPLRHSSQHQGETFC